MQDTIEERMRNYHGAGDRVFTPEEEALIAEAVKGAVEYGLRLQEASKKSQKEQPDTP